MSFRGLQQASEASYAHHLVFSHKKGKVSMRKLSQFVVEFLKAEDGPTAVEYAVMLALIIVVCLAAVQLIGTNASTTFSGVGSTIAAT